MKITDLKCAIIGNSPVVRIVTDAGISGFAQVETFKPYLKPHVLAFHEALLGQDPTNVERVMQRIRQRGAFKPWGAAVSVIETALWDLAGRPPGFLSISCWVAKCAIMCVPTTVHCAHRCLGSRRNTMPPIAGG